MALEYQLKFEDGADLRTLAGGLLAAGFEATDDPTSYRADGLLAVVGGAADRFGRWGPLHFRPHAQVFFACSKLVDYDIVMTGLLGAIGELLAATDVDAALTFDNELVLLLRRHGELVLTNRDDWWATRIADKRFDEYLDLPHRLEPLPVI